MLSRYESVLPKEYFLDRIQGKKILVIGSGPSLYQRDWENLNIDGIITVSFWYNLEKLLNRKDIIFSMYNNQVDLNNPNLNKHLQENEHAVGFEHAPTPFFKSAPYLSFKERYKHKYVSYFTKNHYDTPYSGTAARVCYFALNFNPAELYFIGLDGYKDVNADPTNAFRPGDWYKPLLKKTNKDSQNPDNINIDHQKTSIILRDEALKRGTRLYNLGEGLDYNNYTKTSKEFYPLTDEIKRLINA